ncbi:ssDNA endonuclease and repair protein rad10 [Orbilia brochopaga]|uniref:SsDNA endonuclease and repair protein rad10 n=1 Tax=Orbilia brochopaga TaxID=3140254 RepID=A0AAV9VAT0_9PEZI
MDDYGDIDDAGFTAVADAAERAHKGGTSTAATTASAPQPSNRAGATGSKPPVVQPVPRKIHKPAGPSSIIVNTRQKGNPLLPYIKSVPWEYGDIVPDYLATPTTGILFLSLKYHRLHPEYIYTRIKSLGRAYTLRVLLVLVDTEQHSDPLKELTKAGLVHNITVILSWSPAEAGRYVETYKMLENAPATMIKERQKEDYMSRVEDFATSVKGVNRTDAVALISMFGSVRAAVNASEEQIGLVPGWGEKKTRRWCSAVRENFRVGGALGKKRREEEGDGGEGERVAPLNPMKEAEMVAINRRLGILGPAKPAEKKDVEMVVIDGDEEEALLAMEEEERKRKIPVPRGDVGAAASATGGAETTTEGGVMAALAKLRKQ